MEILKGAFSLGAKAGKILNRPHIPALKENNAQKGFFEQDQFETVLRYLSEPLRRLDALDGKTDQAVRPLDSTKASR